MNDCGVSCGVFDFVFQVCTATNFLAFLSANCRSAYEEENGKCVWDDKLELKVALPVCLIVLCIFFVFVALYTIRRKNEMKHRDRKQETAKPGSTNESYANDA